ncbi:MAG: hypothetical protein ACT4QF_23970 [Sporichthyaceae bacterium]
MSTGQLLVRIRAWEREQTWSPRYVANELAGTSQAAATAHATAALRRAQAGAADDGIAREGLVRRADEAAALAAVLDARCSDLTEADAARALWYAHTAGTRAAADRAKFELAARRCDLPADVPVTADQWLAAHRADQRVEDSHLRIVSEADLGDVDATRHSELAALDGVRPLPNQPQAVAPRKLAVAVPSEDEIRIPTAEQTSQTLARARAALAEIGRREQADAERLADENLIAYLSAHQFELRPEHELERAAVR